MSYERTLLRTVALGGALGLLGCGGAADRQTAPAADSAQIVSPPASGLTRGIVTAGSTPARFVRCSSTDTLRLDDPDGQLATARKGLGARALKTNELFVTARAQNVGTDALSFQDVLYLSPEKFDCFTDWQSFDLRATGNDPGWVAEVLGPHVKLERQGASPAEWNDAKRDSTSSGVRVTAGSGSNAFELLIERRGCVNSVSGAYSVWSAQVRTGNTVLQGCSVDGR